MRNKISFLAVFAIALNANCVYASDCVGNGCEIEELETAGTVEVLNPIQYEINWGTSQCSTCDYDYNCPFETAEECAIWYKKPVYKTTVAPRAPHINPIRVDDMIIAISSDLNISGNDEVMSPLMERYNMLMNAADACCTSGIVYKLREKGADDESVYEFLKDDANHFAITKRCLVTSNEDIAFKYSNGVTGQMVADVRNACLCKNKQWFDSLLQPFNDIYERVPEFEQSAFPYTYKDGMSRELTVSVNEEVQTALGLLSACPK